jgi:hypothetical protein
VTWFINSWRSDGALLDEALPRLKVGAPAARMAKKTHGGQKPGAPQVQDGGRDTDGDGAVARRILPHTCQSGSDQINQGITRRRKLAGEERPKQ